MDKKPKILIADDSYMNREILSDILGDTYVYSMAENGVQAVELMPGGPEHRPHHAGHQYAGNGRLRRSGVHEKVALY